MKKSGWFRLFLLPSFFALFLLASALAARTEGVDNWHRRNPAPTANQLTGITYGNGLYVAVGKQGTVQTSSDGIKWTLRHSDITSMTAVTFGNGRFVAVGDYGSVLTSTDGTNWTSAYAGTGSLVGVAYADGAFVAVNRTDALISTNGLDWSAGNHIAPGPSLEGIAYANGRFVAVSGSGVIYTSTNLVAWTLHGTPYFFLAVTYGNNTFVAVGGREILTSSNGFDWITRTSGITDPLSAIAYGNGTFVAVSSSGAIVTSSNGVSWAGTGNLVGGSLRGTAFGGGLFVAVGDNGQVWTSSDPSILDTWTNWTSLTDDYLVGVAYGNGTFVTIGGLGAILRSDDGTNWTVQRQAGQGYLSGIAFGGGQFVVGGYGFLMNSPDGRAWVTHVIGPSVTVAAVAYGGGVFAAVGNHLDPLTGEDISIVMTSADGAVWTEHSLGILVQAPKITYGNGRFVIVSGDYGNDKVLFSSDGATWRCASLGANLRISSITFGNNLFVALGQEGIVAASPDGVQWFIEKLGYGGFLAATYWDGLFVAAVGDGIATSVDGLAWSNRFYPTEELILFDVAGGNGSFVAVGFNTTIVQSDLVGSAGSGPPAIVQSPQSQNAIVGATARFGVGVGGAPPFSYQWLKDGAPISGASNGVLVLANVQPSDAGEYQVRVANAPDQVTSGVAVLSVTPVDPLDYWNFRYSGLSPYVNLDPTLNAVAYGNGTFVAMGAGGLALSSSNGLVWSRHLLPLQFDTAALAFGNGTFVALGSDGIRCVNPLISQDGITWTEPLPLLPECLSVEAIAFGNGKFVAVGFGQIVVSTNGVGWTTTAYEFNFELKSITYGNGIFVAVGSDFNGFNYILTSPDGFGWTYRDYERDMLGGPYGSFLHIAYGNGRFVITGLNGYTLVSEDGINWDSHFLPLAATLDVISYGQGLFTATPVYSPFGDSFTILTSVDGIVWVPHSIDVVDPAFGGGGIRDIVFGQNTFVAVSLGGLILQSDPLSAAPPFIVRQPRGKTVVAGNTVALNVLTAGSSPLTYEWYKDGVSICWSNSPTVQFDYVQLSQMGDYQAVVRNNYGSVTSVVVRITVEPFRPILSLRFDSAAQLTISGCTGCSYVIHCRDLFDPNNSIYWHTLAIVTLPTSIYTWTDQGSPYIPGRLYRVTRFDSP